MPNNFWKNVSYYFGLLSIFVLFGLVVMAANIEIKDLDLWLHLKMGELITQNRHVPAVDILSCTIAGKPWVNHEWLFQVLSYFIYHNWGADGLITMQVVVVSFTFLILLFLGYNKEKQFGPTFILLLVMMVYQLRFTIRPDIFSLLFFALYIYILSLHLEKRWSMYVLFFIQILWANFHGFFFFGPFIVLVGIGAEYLKRHVTLPWEWNKTGRLSDEEFKQLKKIFCFVMLASFINPLTFKGAWYPISVMLNLPGKSRIFFGEIQELKPPVHLNDIFSLEPYPYYRILILLSAMSFIFNRRKIDIGDFFIWLIFLLVSLVAIRNLVFFSFVAYLVCMTNFGNISANDVLPLYFKNKKFFYITLSFCKLLLTLWMFQYAMGMSNQGYFDFDKMELKSEFGGITQRNYPDKAADFLVKNNIRGNFFNDFNSGAYLIGRCAPKIKVFIDGRTEVYGSEFFQYYNKIWAQADVEQFKEAAKRYRLTGVLLDTVHEAAPPKILSYLYKSKEWIPVYFDYDGLIFLKDVPENRFIINKFQMDLSQWKPPLMDLKRLGSRQVVPYQYINRAYTLESVDLDDAALKEVGEVLKILPNYISAYKILGKIYGKKNENEKAFENFRIAAMFSPGDKEIRSNFALAYEKVGDLKGAIRQYNLMITQNPKDPKWYFVSARAFAKDKQYTNAIENLKKGHALDRKAITDILEIGDIIFKAENFEAARQAYLIASDTKKGLGKVQYKIGLCYNKLGQQENAIKTFKAGLLSDPNNEEIKKDLKILEAHAL